MVKRGEDRIVDVGPLCNAGRCGRVRRVEPRWTNGRVAGLSSRVILRVQLPSAVLKLSWCNGNTPDSQSGDLRVRPPSRVLGERRPVFWGRRDVTRGRDLDFPL